MAARENQGLQIALIIFVMLTIVLIVTTYLFFRNYSDEREKSKALETANKQKDDAARSALAETELVKTVIGAAQTEKQDDVKKAADDMINLHGEGLAESKRNYRALVDHMVDKLRKNEAAIKDLTRQVDDLNTKLKTNSEAAAAEVAQYTAKLDATAADLAKERETFGADRAEITDSKDKLAEQFKTKNLERDELTREATSEIARLTRQRDAIQKQIDLINDDKLRNEKAFEAADGKINRVDQRLRLVWLNLGTADGLKRQTSFMVFPADETNPRDAKEKGKIEVVRVTGWHQAEARIVEDNLSDPIMPGDKIFSISWEPGRAEHFALAGRMDIDGDGNSDRQQIRDLIALNGGVIDSEVTDDGEKKGSMSIATKYLVLGEQPGAESANLDGYSEIQTEAQKLGVRTIGINEFLKYLGYKVQDRTVGLGRNAKGEDFKPRLPNDVQRTLPGKRDPDYRKPRGAPKAAPY